MTDAREPPPLPTAARWEALEPLIDDALGMAPNARGEFLDRTCGNDAALRREVDRILAACERLRDTPYFEEPAVTRFASLWDEGAEDERFRSAIADCYRVEGEVGQGGMAIVYRARDTRDDSVVALKVLRTTTSKGGAVRFRREIAVAARLRHPSILPLLDSGERVERLWYTMPMVAGVSLGTRVRRDGRLPIAVAATILRQVADGLVHAHERGVVHRDLKPDNVLLDGEERAVIADFGVAKALLVAADGDRVTAPFDGIRTATGVGVGTPAYMAPEQCAGERSVDHRADLYALGVMAYELLTGVPPFVGTSRQALVTAHLAERPVRLSARRPEVPKALDALVMRLLEKRAVDRPASATELVAALDRVAGSA